MKSLLPTTLFTILLLFVPSRAIFNTTTCPSTSYFDTTLLNCNTCQTGASVANATACKCNGGYTYATDAYGSKAACTQCTSSQQASSADRKTCMTCPSNGPWNGTECNCPSGYAITDTALDGRKLPAKVCTQCQIGYIPDPNGKGCVACPLGMTTTSTSPNTCFCDTSTSTQAGDICMLNTNTELVALNSIGTVTAARSLTYTDTEDTTGRVGRVTISSGTIEYLFTKAGVGCRSYFDTISCQVLANLCVLTLYSGSSTSCRVYQNLMTSSTRRAVTGATDAGYVTDLPWIYFQNNPLDIINNAGLKLTVTLGKGSGSSVDIFTFFVAKYAVNGTYLGTEALSNQLLACPNSVQAGEYLKTFGTPFVSNCDLDLTLIQNTETYFYELFLKDTDGTAVPIPIKIMNETTSTGATPNSGDLNANVLFSRRFFVYDTVSGITSTTDYVNGASPSIIRFAKNMRLIFSVTTADSSKINRPYLEIEYASKEVKDFATNSTSYVTFQSVFKMDISSFWTTVTILFIITNIIAGIMAIFRTYVWARYNPSIFNPESWPVFLFFRLILNLMKTWSEVMFFFLFIITGYWFIFYKMQNTVYFLVPNENTNPTEFVAFRVVFGLTVSFNLISILNMIREQVQMDFFMIDWEKPRLTYKRDINREVYLQSAWRMILVANEFNELQTSRYYSIELLYMIYGFFMIGLQWEQFSAIVPSLTITVGEGIARNVVLKFFLAVFLLFVIGMILYGLRKAVTLKYPSSIQEFTDLCSIANISIFFFDRQFHGYYVHGMAPSGQSEGSISELKTFLDQESKGMLRSSRGLLANDNSNLQTYEIFFPYEARLAYNNLYKSEITKEIYAKQAAQQMSNQVQFKMNKALPKDFDFARLEGRRLVIQEHLKLYIEGVRVESDKSIRDKTPAMRFFGIPPVDIETLKGNPLFYKDSSYGFQNTVFYGNEFTLLICDILIYTMWDIIVQNTFIALFLSYFTNKLITFTRQFFGERNISQKALIDEAFLI